MKSLNYLLKEAKQKHYDIGICAQIIDNQKKFLLVNRLATDTSPGFWEMPGGSVDLNEDLSEALAREIEEEVGLKTFGPPIYVGYFDFFNLEKRITKRKFCFRVEARGRVRLGPDHDKYYYFTTKEVKRLSLKGSNRIFKDHYKLLIAREI